MNGHKAKQLHRDAVEDVETFIAEKGTAVLGNNKKEDVIKGEYAKKKRNYKKMNWRQRTVFSQG